MDRWMMLYCFVLYGNVLHIMFGLSVGANLVYFGLNKLREFNNNKESPPKDSIYAYVCRLLGGRRILVKG